MEVNFHAVGCTTGCLHRKKLAVRPVDMGLGFWEHATDCDRKRTGRLASMSGEENKRNYARYIEILNAHDFDALPEVVDPGRYKEIPVGLTPGWVNLEDAITAFKRVPTGIPDLHARIDDMAAEDDKVYACLTSDGDQHGALLRRAPTGCSYEVNVFDWARFEEGRIVERIQQSVTVSQLRQMYWGAAKKAGAITLVGATALLALKGRKGRSAGAKGRAGGRG